MNLALIEDAGGIGAIHVAQLAEVLGELHDRALSDEGISRLADALQAETLPKQAKLN